MRSCDFLLNLLRVEFDQDYVCNIPDDINWRDIMSLAKNQGVDIVAFDAANSIHEKKGGVLEDDLKMDIDTLMDWTWDLTKKEDKYVQHINAICEMAELLQSKGVDLVLLKGCGLSLNYPSINHRHLGDIDIYSSGNQHKIDGIIRGMGIAIPKRSRHHSSFTWNGIIVENHYTILDQDNHKSNVRLEKLLNCREIVDLPTIKLNGTIVHLLHPTENAIYLLRHAGEHFSANEINLRQILDLGTFFQKHFREIEWDKVLHVYKDENMQLFYDAIATICVRDLGFNSDFFVGYRRNFQLADRVLADIFTEKKKLPMDVTLLKGLGQKFKYYVEKALRWYNNRWKYKIVYKESLFESFSTLAINRLRN